MFAVELRAPFPRKIARRIDPRLVDQCLIQVAIGPFELSHEDPRLCPALPDLLMLVIVVVWRTVMALSRFVIKKACHCAPPKGADRAASRKRARKVLDIQLPLKQTSGGA